MHRTRLCRALIPLAIMATIIGQRWLAAEGPANAGKRRALPPKWDQRTLDKFFTDARATLEGDRPNFNNGAASTKATSPDNPSSATPDSVPGGPSGDVSWSKLIS